MIPELVVSKKQFHNEAMVTYHLARRIFNHCRLQELGKRDQTERKVMDRQTVCLLVGVGRG